MHVKRDIDDIPRERRNQTQTKQRAPINLNLGRLHGLGRQARPLFGALDLGARLLQTHVNVIGEHLERAARRVDRRKESVRHAVNLGTRLLGLANDGEALLVERTLHVAGARHDDLDEDLILIVDPEHVWARGLLRDGRRSGRGARQRHVCRQLSPIVGCRRSSSPSQPVTVFIQALGSYIFLDQHGHPTGTALGSGTAGLYCIWRLIIIM
jgi:hypothetical protein